MSVCVDGKVTKEPICCDSTRAQIVLSAALAVAAKYAITGYDAQYVALAQSLNVPLITEDRKFHNAVPGIAFSMQEFLVQ